MGVMPCGPGPAAGFSTLVTSLAILRSNLPFPCPCLPFCSSFHLTLAYSRLFGTRCVRISSSKTSHTTNHSQLDIHPSARHNANEDHQAPSRRPVGHLWSLRKSPLSRLTALRAFISVEHSTHALSSTRRTASGHSPTQAWGVILPLSPIITQS